ncbi:retinol dehydrogenase 14 isoform X3 [Dermacentor silvarum]|uniref:retinol dehydrogenase 14 isoform X3 n=1 Tax=Dermacentor silvarum TaxID=543639 RepID=UPI002100C1BD|nr:retinol dehydrogenase 14 isoform X3 [Dermacentor silvarum]
MEASQAGGDRQERKQQQPLDPLLWLKALVAELLLFVKIVLLAFEHMWEKPTLCHSQASMEGNTVIVTGATSDSKKVKLTEDGFEEIFQANYLAPLLLTVLLLDLLKKSSPSRVINVASDFHRLGEVGSVAQKARGVNLVANPTAVYGNAKLALCMATVALADRLRGTGVTVNSLHPGAVKTHIADEGPGLRKFLFDLILIIKGKTPLEGAQTTVRLAVDPELEQTSGEYFENCAPAAPCYRSAHLADHRLADEVLRSSLELLNWRGGRPL